MHLYGGYEVANYPHEARKHFMVVGWHLKHAFAGGSVGTLSPKQNLGVKIIFGQVPYNKHWSGSCQVCWTCSSAYICQCMQCLLGVCLLQIDALKVAPQVSIWHDLQPNHGLHKTNTYHIQLTLNGDDSIKVPALPVRLH